MPEFSRSSVVAVFVGLGFADASKWSKERLMNRVIKLPETATDNESIGDTELDNVLDELIASVKDGDSIEIVDDTKKDAKPTKEKKAKASKGPKVVDEEKAEEAEEEAAVEQEEEVEAPKETKGKGKSKGAAAPKKTTPKPKKAKDPTGKRPGVISEIISILTTANSKRCVTIDDIVGKLMEKFPDRAEDGMRSTVKTQVKYRLPKTHDLHEKDGKYWIAS